MTPPPLSDEAPGMLPSQAGSGTSGLRILRIKVLNPNTSSPRAGLCRKASWPSSRLPRHVLEVLLFKFKFTFKFYFVDFCRVRNPSRSLALLEMSLRLSLLVRLGSFSPGFTDYISNS